MRRIILAIAFVGSFLALTAIDALAQRPAPNRKQTIIEDILPKCPQAFANAPVKDAHRRQVIPFVVAELNKIDDGNWALLYRLDRQDETPEHGRLTVDVIVWRPTKEHFDVLSDNGGMWKGHGPITDRDWLMRDPADFPTVCGTIDPPTPPAPPAVDVAALFAVLQRRVDAIDQRLAEGALQHLEIKAEISHAWEDITRMLASLPPPPPAEPIPVAIPCLRGRVIGQTVTLCPVP